MSVLISLAESLFVGNRARQTVSALILAACIFVLPSPACAGFKGPGAPTLVTSVREALKARDDAPCTLEGKIEARIPNRKNRYLFSDSTGKIIVEIKKDVFGDQIVTPQDDVRIDGEVDWSSKHENEIEVDTLVIIR